MRYKIPISVIMPCYNNEAFIYEAIQSILDQIYEAFELIIINDGSNDNTELEIFKFKDPRIIYKKNTLNQGNYSVRNLGISLAKGKYICMMDSDDIAMPNRLKQQLEFLESNKHIGCIGSASEVIDETGRYIGLIKRPYRYSEIKVWLLKNCYFHQPTMMIRRHSILKHQLFYNEKFKSAGDYDFFVRASNKFQMRNLDKVLLKYRRHSAQISTAKSFEQVANADGIRKGQLKKFGLNPTDKEIELHLKLMKDENINNSDMERCEAWCNKLLETNYLKKIYNQNNLYQMLKYSLQTAVRKLND